MTPYRHVVIAALSAALSAALFVVMLVAPAMAAPGSSTSIGPRVPATNVPRLTVPSGQVIRNPATIPATIAAFGAATCPRPIGAISRWPLRRRVAQLLLVGVDAVDLRLAQRLVVEQHIGGILLRSASGATVPQVTSDLRNLRHGAGVIAPFVAVDEEGGRVQPLRQLVGTLPSARRLARQYTSAQARTLVARHAQKLADLGITMVLGPVLDVTDQSAGDVIGDRSFSNDPQIVAEFGAAYAAGLRDAGLIAVIKHFPGHGAAGGDSHTGRVMSPQLSELERTDVPPFRSAMAAGPVAVMMGHLEVPGLSETTPASVSRQAITKYLRSSLKFRGLVMTDSLSMGAITSRWRAPGAAAETLVAGADVALFVTISERDAIGVIDAVEQIVIDGRLPETQLNRSVWRVLQAKGIDPCAVKIEPAGPRISPVNPPRR